MWIITTILIINYLIGLVAISLINNEDSYKKLIKDSYAENSPYTFEDYYAKMNRPRAKNFIYFLMMIPFMVLLLVILSFIKR